MAPGQRPIPPMRRHGPQMQIIVEPAVEPDPWQQRIARLGYHDTAAVIFEVFKPDLIGSVHE